MSSSWLSLYSSEEANSQGNEKPFSTLLNRKEAFRLMEGGHRFDLVVFGCGLSGIAVAREAALEGAQVLVIEPGYHGDHACAWRESILRELSRAPWSLVKGARILRQAVTSFAPHLARGIVCDLSKFQGLGARVASRSLRSIASALTHSDGPFDLPDMDERLLLRELTLAARQEGVFVMTATAPGFVERDVESGTFRVSVRDLLSDEQVVIRGGGLFVDPTFSQPLASRIGTPITKIVPVSRPHVVVVCSVEGDGEVGRARLFELPHGSVGTLCEIQPGIVEVSLLDVGERADHDTFSNLARQICEGAGYTVRGELSRWRAGAVYGPSVTVENRRGILLPHESAPWNVLTVIKKTLAFVESDGVSRRMRRPLPGEWRGSERESFIRSARGAGVSESVISAVLTRWQGRVRYIPDMERGFEEVCPGVLRGEITLAVESDQVTSLEDLVFGSLALHMTPGWRDLVRPIAEALGETGVVDTNGLDVERVMLAQGDGTL
jgi:hypothetical protein